jgi:hypothetical protein
MTRTFFPPARLPIDRRPLFSWRELRTHALFKWSRSLRELFPLLSLDGRSLWGSTVKRW